MSSKQEFEFEIESPYEGKFQESKQQAADAYSKEDLNHSADDEDEDLGEEIYSVYDDDEAWPRRLQENEVEMADSFFDAVECGECDVVEELLGKFPQLVNVTRQKQGNDFALYIAAGMGDLEMADTIMKPNRSTPVQVHARTVHGHTALSAAALFGHPSVVESLIACGLDVNSKNVEGLRLVDEVLDDIDYSLVGDDSDEDDLELSQSVTRSGGGSDPLLLEKAAVLLLRGGATMSSSNVYAFHDKFCGAWGDVTDDELQQAIERACQLATQMELEQERTNEERARTPALVVRRLNKDGSGGRSSGGVGDLEEESRPSLFKAGSTGRRDAAEDDDDDDSNPNGFAEMTAAPHPRVSPPNKGGRSRGGRLRQRRYIRSPKVATALGGSTGDEITPSKPLSPDKKNGKTGGGGGGGGSPSESFRNKNSGTTVRPRGTPPRVIQDLSALIQEEVVLSGGGGYGGLGGPPEMTHSDDSLDVSWSKQVDGPPQIPPRPRSHGDNTHGDVLEESHPPRVVLPSIAFAGKK